MQPGESRDVPWDVQSIGKPVWSNVDPNAHKKERHLFHVDSKKVGKKFLDLSYLSICQKDIYRKVTNRSTSRLVAPSRIFRLLMKGKFDVYLLWPMGKKLIFAILAWSTVPDSTLSSITSLTVHTVHKKVVNNVPFYMCILVDVASYAELSLTIE